MVLDQQPTEATDRVLFRLAMIHLLPASPVHDPDAGRADLDRLLASFPESPLAEPARLVLDLQTRVDALDARSDQQSEQITELTEQLEALKRIDLQRTNPPPRH